MTISKRLCAAAFALSVTLSGALTACGSRAAAHDTPDVTISDPKVGEHEALAPTNEAGTPTVTCTAPDCRFGPR
jgi:hypothetical protein